MRFLRQGFEKMRPRLFVLFLFLSASSAEQRRTDAAEEDCQNDRPFLLHYFSWADYAVLGSMLLVSCMIGTFYGFFAKKQETSEDFLLGGSSMGTFPMAMSLAASFITAIELLGNPAEMYAQVGASNMLDKSSRVDPIACLQIVKLFCFRALSFG